MSLTIRPWLVSNLGAQMILLHQFPDQLALQTWASPTDFFVCSLNCGKVHTHKRVVLKTAIQILQLINEKVINVNCEQISILYCKM
jgi:hypothetical protein